MMCQILPCLAPLKPFSPAPTNWKGSMTHSRPKLRKETPILSRRIAMLESKLEASSESIKSKIEAQSTKNNNGNVVKPKCPICFEEMSTKIAQCISGHLLCWSCKEKMEDQECAFCDQPVNGRAYGMEAYLRTIFG